MIQYNPKSWMSMIFHLTKSDTIQILWKELIFIFLFSLGIAGIQIHFFPHLVQLDKLFSAFQILGFVISLLLVFRTNTAYDRWWEGRRKWGELVNDSRNLSVKLAALNLSETDREFFARHISNFPKLIKEHLRKGIKWELLELSKDELDQLQNATHAPSQHVLLMYKKCIELTKKGVITGEELLLIDKNLNGLIDVVGACERIKNTPIPYSYSMFFKKFIFVYMIGLPLAFVTNFGYFSAFITTFIFYVMVSLEVLAEEIEDPFGEDDNDLPTDQIAERIEGAVKGILIN